MSIRHPRVYVLDPSGEWRWATACQLCREPDVNWAISVVLPKRLQHYRPTLRRALRGPYCELHVQLVAGRLRVALQHDAVRRFLRLLEQITERNQEFDESRELDVTIWHERRQRELQRVADSIRRDCGLPPFKPDLMDTSGKK